MHTMTTYDLNKEDWEAMQELAHYTGRPDRVSQLPSKVILLVALLVF